MSTSDHLGWFLGPKAENADDFERLLLLILRDYVHWRRNYFPADPILLNESRRRDFHGIRDSLDENTQRLLALLRRNFPFYSPRYLAHELSDTLMPAALGFVAGLLYNPNNVTPEAAPVTVDLEVEACSAILQMLGFRPPPKPLPEQDLDRYYADESAKGFGWAHLTPGGTLSNVEALWVARDVKYFPLAACDVARKQKLTLEVKLPDGSQHDLRSLSDSQLISLKPNECVYLLARLTDSLRRGSHEGARQRDVWDHLRESSRSIARGVDAVAAVGAPVVLVASTAHYSIKKAAQVLGLGRDNVHAVPVDSRFRVDVNKMREQILRARAQGRNPFCVIATLGSTEEGAIDPIHDIVDMRVDLEKNHNLSFWLHVDGAWGGFIRSLFCPEEVDQAHAVAEKASNLLGIAPPVDGLSTWHESLRAFVADRAAQGSGDPENDLASSPDGSGDSRAQVGQDGGSPEGAATNRSRSSDDSAWRHARNSIKRVMTAMGQMLKDEHFSRYAQRLETLPDQLDKAVDLGVERDAFKWTFDDDHRRLSEYVSSAFSISLGPYRQDYAISWPARDVCAAFLRVPAADSVTLDPHKMGYVPYPAGAVAFRNDRVRHFVRQEAPYITATSQANPVHRPPVHRTRDDGQDKVHRDAFGPFILEGSRPGAAAAGVWLAVTSVPLTRHSHGAIVRASVLAAKALYEWLAKWGSMHAKTGTDIDYEFVPLTDRGPDTNIVTFTVKKRTSGSLAAMNALSEAVYRQFTIEAELGDNEYSYSQPFFLSRTLHEISTYTSDELAPFAERSGLRSDWRGEYADKGLVVLRASVMNPYLTPLRELGKDDLIGNFVRAMAGVAESEVRRLDFPRRDS